VRLEVIEGGESSLAERTAVWLADRLWAAVAERGVAHLAVSGGNTPATAFVALAIQPVPWEQVHIWQVDERVAPDGDPDRNATGLREHLLTRVPIEPEHVHLMDVTADDLSDAARRYEQHLRDACGAVLDIIHLGLGDDGHTASWPPGDPVIGVTDRDVATAGPFHDRVRMTLTVPAVNRGRHLVVLVAGEDKAPVVKRLFDGDTSIPASHLRRTGTTILADEAAGKLARQGAGSSTSTGG
jgi:6-phosphogluconolactonase